MDEPSGPSPFATPKVDVLPPDQRPPTGRIGLGLALICVSLLMLSSSVLLVLDPNSEGARYWARVGVMTIMGAGGLRSGWRMGAGRPGGYTWLAMPIGGVLIFLIISSQ